MAQFKVGNGFDVHPFAAGRKLVIGGVTIAHELGLDGHSDADVLLHAVCDAILGALGKGDIGQQFPDSDERYRNADSRAFLRTVWLQAITAGYKLGNVDATIVAQAPRLAPFLKQMVANIAADLDCTPDLVNVKATTTERLGFTGRGEGIAALATVLIARSGS